MSRNGSDSDALLLGLAAIAAAKWGPGALARLRGGAVAPGSLAPPVAGPLSARRLRGLSLIPEIMPAKFRAPSELGTRFAKLSPGYDNHIGPDGELVQTFNGTTLPKGFTNCGSAVCYIGRGLALQEELSRCGLEQLRINARKWGAWVEPGEGRLPRPCDPYGIDQPSGGLIVHVGIVVDASGPTWETADAGQGPKEAQEAHRMTRAYDAKALTIGGPNGARRLAGWCDLDKVPVDARLAGAKVLT